MTRIDRLELTYKLVFHAPFHAGTGLRVGLIDRTIVRDRDGYLYLPGSTIKGVLRQHCEELSRLYEILDETMLDLIASPHDTQRALWSRGHFPSLVTRIFGSRELPGRLIFDDARQDDEARNLYDNREEDYRGKPYRKLQTELATQVRLDRPTRTAVPGALYTSEFGQKGILLKGKISGWLECFPVEDIGEPAPTYSLLLLLAGLHLLDSVGASKSTGKGHCHCEITEFKYDGRDCEKAQWESWLDHLEMLSYYSETVRQEEKA